MTRHLCLPLFVLAVAAGCVVAGGGPPLPYYDWGACPFECCSYRAWTANDDVKLYQAIGSQSVVVVVTKGEEVVGVTGVVITRKAGRVKVLHPVTLDEAKGVKAAPGDILYTLHYLGEGVDRFWFRGQLHDGEFDATEVELKPSPESKWQVLALPENDWWVKVRTRSGKVGWSKDTERFDHIDACE